MEYLRSFIAIDLPEKLKMDLARLQARLRVGEQDDVNWVDTAGMHLTLKFLGNVPKDKIEDILAAMGRAVRGLTPFKLKVASLGAFPGLGRVQVVWVGLEGDLEKLGELHRRVEAQVGKIGFPSESRPFKAHLTLGRVRGQSPPGKREWLGKRIAGENFSSDTVIEVGSINLMKSQLTREGAVYTRIRAINF